MKRFRVQAATAILAGMVIGCDGGLAEGPPKEEIPKGGQNAQFKAEMERMGKQMQGQQGKPKAAPGTEKPADKPADKPAESK